MECFKFYFSKLRSFKYVHQVRFSQNPTSKDLNYCFKLFRDFCSVCFVNLKKKKKFKFCPTLTFYRRLEMDINTAACWLKVMKQSHLSRWDNTHKSWTCTALLPSWTNEPFSFPHSVFLLQSTLDVLLCYTTTRIWALGDEWGGRDSVGPWARKPPKKSLDQMYDVIWSNWQTQKVQKQKLWIKREAFTECFENSPAESSDASSLPLPSSVLRLASPFSLTHCLPPSSISSSLSLSPFLPPPRLNA